MGSTPSLRVLACPRIIRHQNPYGALLYGALADAGVTTDDWSWRRALVGRYDVVHVHWPECPFWLPLPLRALAAASLIAVLSWQRRRGAIVVWTAHNVVPHEPTRPAWAYRRFRDAFVRRVDRVTFLSDAAVDAARPVEPTLARLPHAVIPHGHYRAAYPPATDRAIAHRRLALPADSHTALFLGQVRAYKGVEQLVDAVRDAPDAAITVVIAGQPIDADLACDLRAAAAADSRIRLALGDVPPPELPDLYGAADLVVLPFIRVSSSGSVIAALSFDRPVLVPDTELFRELRAAVGPHWVRLFRGTLTASVLEDAFAWAEDGQEARTQAPLDAFDWPPIAASTAAFLREGASAR